MPGASAYSCTCNGPPVKIVLGYTINNPCSLGPIKNRPPVGRAGRMRLNLTDSKLLVEFSSIFPESHLVLLDAAVGERRRPEVRPRICGFEIEAFLLSSLLPLSTGRATRLSPHRSTDASTSTRSSVLKTAGARPEDGASPVTDGYQAFRSGCPSHYPLCQSSSLC